MLFTFLAEIDTESLKDASEQIVSNLDFCMPELVVTFGALAILITDLIIPVRLSRHLAWAAIGVCCAAAGLIGHNYDHSESLFLGMLAIDSFANFFKYMFLIGSVPLILLSFSAADLEGRRMGEYYGILLAAVLGGMLMASATHFLMLFMGLELISLCSYVLVGYFRRNRRSAEASLKYIIYGGVASALMAYGFSLWFGLTGSGDVSALANILWNPEDPIYTAAAMQNRTAFTVVLSFFLILVGFSYKMSSIPMHFWAPDVYDGAPTTITAFLSVLSKAAGFAISIRFLQSLAVSIQGLEPGSQTVALWYQVDWNLILILLAILTMSVGNLGALWQTNLKRLMAYSSIAHAGYLMMGLALIGTDAELGGIPVIAFYLLAYLAMNFGVFGIIVLLENRLGSVDLEAYRGLGWRAPVLSAAMTVFVLSLIGIPPTAGFTGKMQLIMGVLDVGTGPFYALAIAAGANTAISAYYYLKILKSMYLERPMEHGKLQLPTLGTVVVLAMMAMTFYLFFRADVLLDSTLKLKMHV